MEIKAEGQQQAQSVQVACSVCHESIPMSEAMSAEATNYVAHFCGLDCYQRWLDMSRTPGDDTF